MHTDAGEENDTELQNGDSSSNLDWGFFELIAERQINRIVDYSE